MAECKRCLLHEAAEEDTLKSIKERIEKLPEKEIIELHNKIDTDKEFVKFLKIFLQLSDENKHLLTLLAIKIKE